MLDMIGVGPFITLPLLLSAMGGPQAMLGWIFGALLAVCDGLVWAELGAAMPQAGGSYYFLRTIYSGVNGSGRAGRFLAFLFIFQLIVSAPLSVASGCIGLSQYAAFIWPSLARAPAAHTIQLGPYTVGLSAGLQTLLAIAVVVVAIVLLYRRLASLRIVAAVMWCAVMGLMAWIFLTGLLRGHLAQALALPAGAFSLTPGFFQGLASAMLIATYDYWGYYNVCFLGDEVKDPGRTIPRALLLSILLVACLYTLMNLSVLAVVPWRELLTGAQSNKGLYVISVFMHKVYGPWAAGTATVLVMWTAFASVFSLLLGYSRVPYAAALDGNYFRAFARIHPEYRFPHISLLALAGMAMLFCFFSLADLIAALVVIRISLQFLLQAVGVIVLRITRPGLPRPFRMWFYPLPALLAITGFIFILTKRPDALKQIRYTVLIVIAGLAVYMFRAWRGRQWPFTSKLSPDLSEFPSGGTV